MEKNELLTIKQVHELYDVTVWDNCALQGYLTDGKKGSVRDSLKFAEFFIDKIPIYGCFIPELVMKEYTFRKNLEWKLNEKKVNLIKKFQSEERVLCVKDFPIGPKVKKGAQKLEENYGINKTDWSICAWAIELSKFFDSAAIISNDIRGLAKLWKGLVCKGIIDKENLGFFPRKELDLYERFI